MKTLAALALTLTACGFEDVNSHWTDGTPIAVVVSTHAPLESVLAFNARVQADMALWNTALVSRGRAAPFRYVDSVHDAAAVVYLRHRSDWPFTGSVGARFDDSIHILAEGDGTLDTYVGDPTWVVVLHELGHSLGLEHNEQTDSVMRDGGIREGLPLSQHDIDAAVLEVGGL